MTVAAILKHKGHDVVSVRPGDSIARVTHVLSDRQIGAALVRDAAGQTLGIVSERDVVQALARHGERTLGMTAAQLMSTGLRTVGPDTTVSQAMTMMTESRMRHLPVFEDGRLIGIVSIGDVVKARLMQQECEVDSLKAYVAGAA
jgi:CBS domain-containing protein